MSNLVHVAEVDDLPAGCSKVCPVDGKSVALFNVAGRLYAIEDTCSHQGGSLGRGTLQGELVQCPRHGWQFDVTTGDCTTRPGIKVERYPVQIEGKDVFIELADPVAAVPSDGVRPQFLVRFGTMGYVGRFEATEPVSCSRGSRVVVRSSRGVELGEVLGAGTQQTFFENQPLAGQLLRPVTPEDELLQRALREGQQRAFDECRRRLAERHLPVELVDAEQLLDSETIIFYFLGDATTALADVSAELAHEFESRIEFRQFMERVEAGCGPGCGTEAAGAACATCETDPHSDGHGPCNSCVAPK